MYKQYFSVFHQANAERLHFAAHSHHYWPDVSQVAQAEAWSDAAYFADRKWDKVFHEVIPDVQRGIADILKLPDPATICFAPNTHEFLLRLLSGIPAGKVPVILTTDSEFYSFRRQMQRMVEENLVRLVTVPSAPFETFVDRFSVMAAKNDIDMIFFSQVFFNSGFAIRDLEKIISAINSKDIPVVIDGYHGFMAMPTDISSIAGRVFYMSGGYKYAMSGEGACFMHCPPTYIMRPSNTGWFAEMDSLAAEKTGQVDYASGGARFFGATFDPVGLYRMRSVFKWMEETGLTVEKIRAHVLSLQRHFLQHVSDIGTLVVADEETRGNFLCYQTPHAPLIKEQLEKTGVIVDNRGDRLRFGFGIYQDIEDVGQLITKVMKR